MVAGVEYAVDCIIYASGFEVGTEYTRRAGYDVTGRDGVRLSEYWAEGMRTKHGTHVHGFPNMFIVQPTQVVPGTTMAYPGQPDAAAAKAIADYLMTLKE